MSLPQDQTPMVIEELNIRIRMDVRIRMDEKRSNPELYLLCEYIDGMFQHPPPRLCSNLETPTSLKWSGVPASTAKHGLNVAKGDPVREQLTLASDSAYAHNCTRSLFHNLPIELISDIARYLSPLARFLMQRVCWKFRAGLAPKGIAPELGLRFPYAKEIIHFACLLRYDVQVRLRNDYERECDMALPISSLHNFGCSGCCTTHHIEDFSDKELNLSPKVRICKGLAARIQLCSHVSFSGLCLLRALRVMKNADYVCEGGDARIGRSVAGPHIGFRGGHTITIDDEVRILEVERDEEATHDQLASALFEKRAYICPHLNSASPQLFGGSLLTAGCPHYTFSQIRHFERKREDGPACSRSNDCHRLLRLGMCVTWAQCRQPNCITRYCLYRRHYDTCNIMLVISRDIPGDPTHPAWLARTIQTVAETEAEGESLSVPNPISRIHTTQSNLQTDRVHGQRELCEGVNVHGCASRFEQCGLSCVYARCRAFIWSDGKVAR